MNPVRIFISHRAESGPVGRDLKLAIQAGSRNRIQVFLAEDIPRGDDWREAIERHLRQAENLILLYGAAYEDWSWCFYEAGYFAAVNPAATERRIYCVTRPNIPAPGPLEHLQMVTSKDQLLEELIGIYRRIGIEVTTAELRPIVATFDKRLFGELKEFEGYPRLR